MGPAPSEGRGVPTVTLFAHVLVAASGTAPARVREALAEAERAVGL